MPKPSTPDIWASGKTFAFQPSQAQQAQGFDYIATVRPSTGAPITDDHDWPLNKITTAVAWVMDQLPVGGLKYGCPLVGSLIQWPLQQMPQEIWQDCGMVFIPYIAQAFDGVKYPLLKQLHPSGVLPSDMRGEFPRGWDNGRGVDPSRALMSAKGFTTSAADLRILMQRSVGGSGSPMPVVNGGNNSFAFNANGVSSLYAEITSSSTISSISTETAPRSIAWNMIVRAA